MAASYSLAVAARAAIFRSTHVAPAKPRTAIRSRLEAVAEDLRRRSPDPPEGFDPRIHALLLSRIDDVERWSLDDLASPFVAVPR
jgi:hypothetical protein